MENMGKAPIESAKTNRPEHTGSANGVRGRPGTQRSTCCGKVPRQIVERQYRRGDPDDLSSVNRQVSGFPTRATVRVARSVTTLRLRTDRISRFIVVG